MREPQTAMAHPPAGFAQPASQSAARFGALVIAGVVIYVALDIIAQFLPPHYNPIKQAESDLGVGPYGWIMALNFVVRGAIALALIAGLRRALAPAARRDGGPARLKVSMPWAAKTPSPTPRSPR